MQANTNTAPRAMLLVISGLIVIATLLFVVGVVIEHNRVASAAQTTAQTAGNASATPTPQLTGEAAEGQASSEGSTTETHTEAGATGQASEATETHKETVLGVDIENPWVVAAFVIVWLALLASLFVFRRRALPVVIAAAVVALVFDIGEIALQFGMSDVLVGSLAGAVAAAHAAIAVLAAWLLWSLLSGNRQASGT